MNAVVYYILSITTAKLHLSCLSRMCLIVFATSLLVRGFMANALIPVAFVAPGRRGGWSLHSDHGHVGIDSKLLRWTTVLKLPEVSGRAEEPPKKQNERPATHSRWALSRAGVRLSLYRPPGDSSRLSAPHVPRLFSLPPPCPAPCRCSFCCRRV